MFPLRLFTFAPWLIILLTFCTTNIYCQGGYGRVQNNDSDSVKTGEQGKSRGSSGPPQPFPYALSSTYLTYLAKQEQEIYKEVASYATALEERLKLARAYMKDYEDSTIKGNEHLPKDADPWQKAAQTASHTLIAYRMIRRFSQDFQALVSHINQYFESKMGERVTQLAGLYNWPSEKDHEEAMDAILRLQYVYDLNLNEFTKGNIAGVKTNVGLTTPQAFKIAEYAAKNEYYTLALDWLHLTESRVKSENDTSVSVFSIANTYKMTIDRHDRDYERNTYLSHLYIFDTRIQGSQNKTAMRYINYKKYMGDRETDEPESGHFNFLALCNGENFQTEQEKARLYCFYDSKRHPYFSINPLKLEQLSLEPYLVQMYDIIGDKWISDLRKTAMPTLQRAPPPNHPNATPRTATYAWLEDGHIPNTPIARRIEVITDLNVRGMVASEALQIASYAFGGHVSTHFDSLGGNPDDPVVQLKGDRVSTFLVYLNEVQKGGLTAFPIIGAHVKPVKGSAVFWYTSLKNGEIDQRMLHGACPVILGHKWIATKWTHLNENFLKRPCALDSEI